MKAVVVNLLSIALMLSCSSPCDAKGEGENPEPSPQQRNSSAPSQAAVDPQAVREALNRYLHSPDYSGAEELGSAIAVLGDRIVPYYIEAAVAEDGKDWEVYHRVGFFLARRGEEVRRETARKLLELLTNEDTSIDLAGGLLSIIGDLGESGLVIEPDLIELRRARPELETRINGTLIAIRSTQCGSIYAARLAKDPREPLLCRTAACGTAARDAGPEVMKLLDHPNRSMRLAAARTLGYIGYTEAVPTLIKLLDDPMDVRFSWVAAESLGRMGAQSAVPALKETTANHWHQAVRDKAKDALEHIATGEPYKSRWRVSNFSFEFEDYNYWGIESTAPKRDEFLQEPLELKLYKSISPAKMKGLSYESEIISSDGDSEENEVLHRERIQQVPDVALRVENGWLAGSDRGEWVGKLMFVADDGQRTRIRQSNVYDLLKLGEKYIAITGYAHFSNDGYVYEVKSNEPGRWTCELWRILPGAPKLCGRLPSGEIFISTSGGGDVILSPDGTFRIAP